MTNQEIIDKLLNGEMKLYQVDKLVTLARQPISEKGIFRAEI